MTLHPYLYCMNNTANRVDPSGEFSLSEISAGINAQSIMNSADTVGTFGIMATLTFILQANIMHNMDIGMVSLDLSYLDNVHAFSFKGGKQKDRDNFGGMKNNFNLNNNDFDEFRKFMHKWKQKYNHGKPLTDDQMQEIFEEWLYNK